MTETNETIEAVTEKPEYAPVEITLETLLESGAHFGHKVDRWNPKMLPYIYGKKGDVHVINLDLTVNYWAKTAPMIKKAASRGATFMFVGTKEQARGAVQEAATRCGAYYINNRWLGGTLTNFETIRRSISKMDRLETLLKKADEPGSDIRIGKKEKLQITRKIDKIAVNLAGVRDMKRVPDFIFVVDVSRDSIAVEEARKLGVPVIALVDTNADPSLIDFPIPTNDDSRRAIELFTNAVADQIALGRLSFNPKARGQEGKPEFTKKDSFVAVEIQPQA